MATMIGGARIEPNKPAAEPCNKPMFKPRRSADEAPAIRACATGNTGPSAAPINPRINSNDMNPVTAPDSADVIENTATAPTSIGLRTPRASDQDGNRKPLMAQVSPSTEDRMPRWRLVRCSSSEIDGNRKVIASRSKNTQPKVRNRSTSRRFSYPGRCCGDADESGMWSFPRARANELKGRAQLALPQVYRQVQRRPQVRSAGAQARDTQRTKPRFAANVVGSYFFLPVRRAAGLGSSSSSSSSSSESGRFNDCSSSASSLNSWFSRASP